MAKLCRYPLFVLLLSSFLQLTLADIATTIIASVFKKTKTLNFVMSPRLLIESLYPIYVGAGGDTLREISKFLKIEDETKLRVLTEFESDRKRIAQSLKGTVTMATALFGSNKNKIPDEYTNILIGILNTDYQTVDFKRPTAAAKVINEWVANNTDNHITHLIDKTPLGAKLMLFSALYFNGNLSLPNPKEITETFYSTLIGGTESRFNVSATLTKIRLQYDFLKEINADIVSVPYIKSKVKLVFLIPKEKNDIQTIENNLHKVNVSRLAPKKRKTFELIIPYFTVKSTQNYKSVFEYIHDDRTISYRSKTFLQDIIQKIEFKQFKSHSQGASGRASLHRSNGLARISLLHPFIFLVKDKFNIYLAGRIGLIK
ncbi:antichymotrypsin-2 [Drosophila mojavensis]|uniref:Serpin domain-containing protein n=1 Tax=Drosophila mojavensis TaxID=7230 RepID=A0A0Q9XPP1_DROMO|nr:antichymotrypsin-2 [Drosophila mojavensis]KRG06449.1 uncharacterized protein Dmoj_GI26005 [Drosophila mojavensis]